MIKVLFVLPLTYSARLPHFRSRFELLSNHIECHILFIGDPTLDKERFKNCTLYAQPELKRNTVLAKLEHTLAMIKRGIDIVRKNKVDIVCTYDPLKLGLVATMIKIRCGCRLIVEINGHLKNASAKTIGSSDYRLITKALFNLICSFSLFFSDAVKLLNYAQFREWKYLLRHKPCFMFHDFIPISLFKPGNREGDYILCAGHPFIVKGVDILLDAYKIVRNEFPDVRLIIMGHCSEPELRKWKEKVSSIPGAELRKPVPYNEMHNYLQDCIIFALPSRSEGMGRVLIEAMACGKALVGTRVGGIPNVIRDGYNGLLCNTGDPDDLADKLHTLLLNKKMRERMGDNGINMSKTIFSETSYKYSFLFMLFSVTYRSYKEYKTGIVYSLFG